ncbi:MAG: tRNA lysidine(34) synthetase TilS [Thermomicrobiales bacterium]|nr:tRNA lysidine(34) synthetase TilS [Thermomicrobiales bacterium]
MDSTPATPRFSKEAGIVQRVRLQLRNLPNPPRHVLVACSAGKDSVALTWVLAELRRVGLIDLTIAHVHHGQHDAADDAMEAVREIGIRLGVPVLIQHLQHNRISGHTGVGIEEALRRERYLALAAMSSEIDADCVALAHHQQDQAETVLLHLIRGAGLEGLSGMQAWDERLVPWWDDSVERTTVRLWRPVLNESADSVVQTAEQSGLPIVEDPTNADTSFRRNDVRLRLLPLLEEIAPGSTGAIARSAEVVQRDRRILHDAIDAAYRRCLGDDGIVRDALMDETPQMQPAVVRKWLMESGLANNLSQDRVDAVVSLVRRGRGNAKIEPGGGVVVVLRAGLLRIEMSNGSKG